MRVRGLHILIISLALFPLGTSARAQSCRPYWANVPDLPEDPQSIAVLDDGGGPALFASFEDFPWGRVYRWRNGAWTDISATMPAYTGARSTWIAKLDDGTGPALYALSDDQHQEGWITVFESFAARWNGTSWALVSPNFRPIDGSAWPLISGDVGEGMSIYGLTLSPPPYSYNLVPSRWTGTAWAPIQSLVSGPIQAWHLLIADLGDGPHLYAFPTTVGGLARWSGLAWEPRTNGLSHLGNVLGTSGVVYDDGTGPAIYITSQIRLTSDPQNDIPGLGKWDGTVWSNVGGPAGLNGALYEWGGCTVFDDASGPAIYVVGGFNDFGGAQVHGIARYQNGQWSSAGYGVYPGSNVRMMASGSSSRGPSLFLGGQLGYVSGSGVLASNIVQLVGCPNCYGDCDQNGTLNVADFPCFVQKFAQGDPYCNGDMSAATPTINVADFTYFLKRFAAGCPR
jgi:hypothetical protein